MSVELPTNLEEFVLNFQSYSENSLLILHIMRNFLKLNSQLDMYNIIYDDFIRNTPEYDEMTPIPKLNIMLKFFCYVVILREHIFDNDKNYETIPCEKIEEISSLILNNDDEISTFEFINKCYYLLTCIQPIEDFVKELIRGAYKNGEPITLENKIKISSKTSVKYFYCPLIENAGLLSFSEVNKVLLLSERERGYSKIPICFKVGKLKRSPHGNGFLYPRAMFLHDISHSTGIIFYITHYGFKKLNEIYDSISHDNETLLKKLFNVIVWAFFFEVSDKTIEGSEINLEETVIDDMFFSNYYKSIDFFYNISEDDINYVCSYLLKAKDLPEGFKRFIHIRKYRCNDCIIYCIKKLFSSNLGLECDIDENFEEFYQGYFD